MSLAHEWIPFLAHVILHGGSSPVGLNLDATLLVCFWGAVVVIAVWRSNDKGRE